jgi:hypothetical protein
MRTADDPALTKYSSDGNKLAIRIRLLTIVGITDRGLLSAVPRNCLKDRLMPRRMTASIPVKAKKTFVGIGMESRPGRFKAKTSLPSWLVRDKELSSVGDS